MDAILVDPNDIKFAFMHDKDIYERMKSQVNQNIKMNTLQRQMMRKFQFTYSHDSRNIAAFIHNMSNKYVIQIHYSKNKEIKVTYPVLVRKQRVPLMSSIWNSPKYILLKSSFVSN